MEANCIFFEGVRKMSLLFSSNLQWVMFSTMILGIAAGAIGCLSYFRRQNLLSDALAHAALPGVVVAFLLIGEKNMLILIAGAAGSALVGAFFIQWITTSSRIKEDTAMGMILSIFYGAGIMLLTVANRTAGGNQSGLDTFIFGQAASMVRHDVITMAVLALVVIAIVTLAYKEWKIFLFDPEFANGIGLSIKGMNILYTLLLVTTIVIGIQAVGVILMAAMMIIPAVSSRYWTQNFGRMLILSSLFGGLSGVFGTLISALGKGWPTGPFVILVSACFFLFSLFFGKEKGLLVVYWKRKGQWKKLRTASPDVTPLMTKGVK